MQRRFEIETFCMDFLHGRNSHLRKLIGGYRQEFLQIDVQLFTKDMFDTSFHYICNEVFNRKPVNKGHVVAILGFAETIHHHHSSSLGHSVDMLIQAFANMLEDIDFYPNHLDPSYCIIL